MEDEFQKIKPVTKILDLGTTVQEGNVDINQCIYCGSTKELTDEHTIPYALWGKWVLRRASCKRCAVLTSQVELSVARMMLNDFRQSLKAPSRKARKKKKWNGRVQLRNDEGKTVEAPIWAAFQYGLFPLFNYLPRGIFNDEKTADHEVVGISVLAVSETQHPSLSGYWSKSIPFNSEHWKRLLAKIAYGEYIRTYDEKFRSEEVSRYILYGEGDSTRFVGGRSDESKFDDVYHITFCMIWEGGRCPIIAYVRLFPFLKSPSYMVYLGDANDYEKAPEKLQKRNLGRDNIWPVILKPGSV
jgi:hypothetical protein